MLCAAIVRSGLLHERISHSASSLILYHLSTDFTCLCHFKEKKLVICVSGFLHQAASKSQALPVLELI
ncbi:hypothetical protein PVAP13_3KG200700 [Panicum virgatum]|uniref:Uncharacterized protein n=1 Tax=Panicum virgatum TaxID=38727 RepID=A0A8T0USY6_PANVG|nr:hypothetical protein PVAP13_3KG200700 [Panicum virgatum]